MSIWERHAMAFCGFSCAAFLAKAFFWVSIIVSIYSFCGEFDNEPVADSIFTRAFLLDIHVYLCSGCFIVGGLVDSDLLDINQE